MVLLVVVKECNVYFVLKDHLELSNRQMWSKKSCQCPWVDLNCGRLKTSRQQ